jgi:hypothetical protein
MNAPERWAEIARLQAELLAAVRALPTKETLAPAHASPVPKPRYHKGHFGLAAAAKPKPTVRASRCENTSSGKLSQEDASSGKILMNDYVFSTRRKFWFLPPRRSFRESCRARLSRDGVEHHRRSQLHW